MTESVGASLLLLSLSLVLGSCAVRQSVYKTNLNLEKPLEFRPRPPASGTTSHACLTGNYYHVYRTDNQYGNSEVWLCCAPVAEILKNSFNSGSSGFISLSQILGWGFGLQENSLLFSSASDSKPTHFYSGVHTSTFECGHRASLERVSEANAVWSNRNRLFGR
jgi:hypothetical protein